MKQSIRLTLTVIAALGLSSTIASAQTTEPDVEPTPQMRLSCVRGPVKSYKLTQYIDRPADTEEAINEYYDLFVIVPLIPERVVATAATQQETDEYMMFTSTTQFDPQGNFVTKGTLYDTAGWQETPIGLCRAYVAVDSLTTSTKIFSDKGLLESLDTYCDDPDLPAKSSCNWQTTVGSQLTSFAESSYEIDGYGQTTVAYNYGTTDNSDNLRGMVVCGCSGNGYAAINMTVVEYDDYKYDQWGNWIERVAYYYVDKVATPGDYQSDEETAQTQADDTPARSWRETREITYRTDSTPTSPR